MNRQKRFDTILGSKRFIDFIERNFDRMSNQKMADKFGVNITLVRTQCYLLGKYRMNLEYWTREQINFLKRNYKKIGDKELAILFNKKWKKEKSWTWKHMEKKRLYLKLKRTGDEIRAIKERNTKRGCWANTSTWETRGEAPVGEIRLWTSQYGCGAIKVIKTEDGFVHYAHWLYEKDNGPMPEGYVVGFKDGNNMNVVPGNLESITRREHLIRNRSLPKHLRDIKNLINKLNQTINLKKNEQRKQRKQAA